jgi:hypothetical protein
MGIVLYALAGLLLGLAGALSLRSGPVRGARPLEGASAASATCLDTASAAIVLALGVWVATSWVLALAGALTAGSLAAASAIETVGAVVLLVRARPLLRDLGAPLRELLSLGSLAALAALLPVVLWIVFAGWRGTVLPPYNHDALAYHLPKAVLLLKAKGFHVFDVPEARIATWPWNYELLLADLMLLRGDDHATALLSVFVYVGFVVIAARTAAAWWGGGLHVAIVAVLVASAPIAVLHTGLHKNDLLTSFLVVAACSWGGRWLATGCVSSAVLSIVALLLAVGTKLNGFFAVAAVAPLLVLGAVRHRAAAGWPRMLGVGAGAVAASFVLGSVSYAVNLVRIHRLALPPQTGNPGAYGDWSNVWQFTEMVIASPFRGHTDYVWNPFAGAAWIWLRNDIWMSDFGAVFSVLAVLLVPCVLRYRRAPGGERSAASLAALAAYLLTLPIHGLPRGIFNEFVRYEIFVLPFVAAWTVSPILLELERTLGKRRDYIDGALSLGAAAWACVSFYDFGLHDKYAPLEYLQFTLAHPGYRAPAIESRAEVVFDRKVGPTEVCALDVAFDTWVYPAYGAHWTRDVRFLPKVKGPVPIDDDVRWVIVDRSWNIEFGHPEFVDMGKWSYMNGGAPTGADLKVFRQLSSDPRFELVYDDRKANQAIFERKKGGS